MRDQGEVDLNKLEVAQRLRTVLHRLSKLAHSPSDQGLLDRLPDLVTPKLAYDAEGSMPGQFPRRERTTTGRKLAVVIHEAKRAIVLFWELCRTDETIGLIPLIERLEDYAKYGLPKFDLGGEDHTGYNLVPTREVQSHKAGVEV